MRQLWNIICFVMILIIPWTGVNAQDQDRSEVTLRSPKQGEALQGLFMITGSTLVDGFQSVELAFSYSSDPSETWFLIHEGDEAVVDGIISQWDTTTITDGTYNLRLTVKRSKSPLIQIVVIGLRVRNYSPIETDTPTPVLTEAGTQSSQLTLVTDVKTSTLTQTATREPISLTATPLPTNPIEINIRDVTDSASRGAASVLTLFVLIGIYFSIRRLLRL
jgi:hypothetical protein